MERMSIAQYKKALLRIEALYSAELANAVDEIFAVAAAFRATYEELGMVAGLSANTISRLTSGKTKYPQYRTIYKLCRACGMKISFSSSAAKKLKIVG